MPGERKIHKKPIPYGGGASMFVGFLVAMLAAAATPVPAADLHPVGRGARAWCWPPAPFSPSGLIDDVRDMSAPAKMSGQVLAASILYFMGVTMYQFKLPAGRVHRAVPGRAAADHGGLGHRPDQRHQLH